ncbi:MAG: homoserine kinase [Acidipila sp.]|nr:homoserine kinase [Acidipila sp.]
MMNPPRLQTFEVRVPASTANLGAGFDCFGLALELFLAVRATVLLEPGARTRARSRTEPGASPLPRAAEQNLIFRAMLHAAEKEDLPLPPLRIAAHSAIPVAGGLGSSAAAVVAGIALTFAINRRALPVDAALRYAKEMDGHPDNVAAALLGGFTVTCVRADGSVAAVRKNWPAEIRVVAVTPNFYLPTASARAVLPANVRHVDAIYNVQRSALFLAALDERRYELLWDAMQDRLHQSHRQELVPGLAGILRMPRIPGLLGLALSGAGPSVIALATGHFAEIGKAIAGQFERQNIQSTIRHLQVANAGQTLVERSSFGPKRGATEQ